MLAAVSGLCVHCSLRPGHIPPRTSAFLLVGAPLHPCCCATAARQHHTLTLLPPFPPLACVVSWSFELGRAALGCWRHNTARAGSAGGAAGQQGAARGPRLQGHPDHAGPALNPEAGRGLPFKPRGRRAWRCGRGRGVRQRGCWRERGETGCCRVWREGGVGAAVRSCVRDTCTWQGGMFLCAVCGWEAVITVYVFVFAARQWLLIVAVTCRKLLGWMPGASESSTETGAVVSF